MRKCGTGVIHREPTHCGNGVYWSAADLPPALFAALAGFLPSSTPQAKRYAKKNLAWKAYHDAVDAISEASTLQKAVDHRNRLRRAVVLLLPIVEEIERKAAKRRYIDPASLEKLVIAVRTGRESLWPAPDRDQADNLECEFGKNPGRGT